ncbi:MAG: hypothetical protein AAGA22_07745, partial [Pseudomonadota bacterium]
MGKSDNFDINSSDAYGLSGHINVAHGKIDKKKQGKAKDEFEWVITESVKDVVESGSKIDAAIATLSDTGEWTNIDEIYKNDAVQNFSHQANEDSVAPIKLLPPKTIKHLEDLGKLTHAQANYLIMASFLGNGQSGLSQAEMKTAMANFYQMSAAEQDLMAGKIATLDGKASAEFFQHGSEIHNNDLRSISMTMNGASKEQKNIAEFLAHADSDTISFVSQTDVLKGDTALLQEIVDGTLNLSGQNMSTTDQSTWAHDGHNGRLSSITSSQETAAYDVLKRYTLSAYNEARATKHMDPVGATMSNATPSTGQTNFMTNLDISTSDQLALFKLAQSLKNCSTLTAAEKASLFDALTNGTQPSAAANTWINNNQPTGVTATTDQKVKLQRALNQLAKTDPTFTESDATYIYDNFAKTTWPGNGKVPDSGVAGIDNSKILWQSLSGSTISDPVELSYYSQLAISPSATYDSTKDDVLTAAEATATIGRFTAGDTTAETGLAAAMANNTLTAEQAAYLNTHRSDTGLTPADVTLIDGALTASNFKSVSYTAAEVDTAVGHLMGLDATGELSAASLKTSLMSGVLSAGQQTFL